MKQDSTLKILVKRLEDRKIDNLKVSKVPHLDKNEIRNHMKHKWRDPGSLNSQFGKKQFLSGKILSDWEIARTGISLRSYKYPKSTRGYKFDTQSRQFPSLNLKIYSKPFQKHLLNLQKNYEDKLFCQKKCYTKLEKSTIHQQKSQKYKFKFCLSKDTLFGYSKLKNVKTKKLKVKTENFQ